MGKGCCWYWGHSEWALPVKSLRPRVAGTGGKAVRCDMRALGSGDVTKAVYESMADVIMKDEVHVKLKEDTQHWGC